MNPSPVTICRAAALRDALGTNYRPGALAVRDGAILEAGLWETVSEHHGKDAQVVDLPRTLLLPGMVNAHAHLDLTDAGPVPFDGAYAGWLAQIMQHRPKDDVAITQAVGHGLVLSRAAGVAFLADIAGSVAAIRARLGATPGVALGGASYLECFGIGRRQIDGLMALVARLRQLPKNPADYHAGADLRFGIAPHAPYSVGPDLYCATRRLAEEREYRLTTHLAESPDEIRFICDADGPLADLLRALDKWDDTLKPTGLHPVDYLEPELRRQVGGGGWLLAHCNYVEDDHIELLAHCHAAVAYCPVASAYFGFPRTGRHRYRDMLAAGVNVCLGTDSILCQPPHEPQPLGILPQMRFLYRRDRTAPQVLLQMATINGLRALGLKESLASFQPGAQARFVGVQIDPDDEADPLVQALRSDAPAQVVGA